MNIAKVRTIIGCPEGVKTGENRLKINAFMKRKLQ